MGNCHPSKTNVRLRLGQHWFSLVTISHVTLSCSQYLNIISRIMDFSKPERYELFDHIIYLKTIYNQLHYLISRPLHSEQVHSFSNFNLTPVVVPMLAPEL